ncbi:MAG: hypothetical protein QME79_03270 [Bacillota bacterium]|nr:hypothetical protein [Bacillota bacterium]
MEWLLFVAGALAVGVSLALGYRERRDFARLQEQAGRARPGELEEISLVVADLEEELTQTAERIINELEERAATLRRLIAEAQAVAAEVGATEISPAEDAVAASAAGAATGATGQDDRKAAPPGAPERKGCRRGWRSVEATVWEMSQQGLGVEQIARQLDIGKGEVKLILDLKKAQAR